jgi:hypothetical protein
MDVVPNCVFINEIYGSSISAMIYSLVLDLDSQKATIRETNSYGNIGVRLEHMKLRLECTHIYETDAKNLGSSPKTP